LRDERRHSDLSGDKLGELFTVLPRVRGKNLSPLNLSCDILSGSLCI
jgi:hypothetical protein